MFATLIQCALCHRSQSDMGAPLSKCANCRVVHYCGRAHQQQAWGGHKRFCKAIKQWHATGDVPASPPSFATWKEYLFRALSQMRAPFQNDDDTGPDPFEHPSAMHQWIFQPHCRVCFVMGTTADTVLTPCSKCERVAHCAAPACAAAFAGLHTPEACERHRIGLAALVMAAQQGNPLTIASSSPVVRPADSAMSPLPQNWGEFFQTQLDNFEVRGMWRICL